MRVVRVIELSYLPLEDNFVPLIRTSVNYGNLLSHFGRFDHLTSNFWVFESANQQTDESTGLFLTYHVSQIESCADVDTPVSSR